MIAGLFILLGCNKESNRQLRIPEHPSFFKNESDMYRQVQLALDKLAPGRKLQEIQSVSYIDSRNASYAFIFYRSGSKESNVVMRQQYAGNKVVAYESVTCEGASCECKVRTVINNQGDVTMDCSCPSCTKLVNN